MALKKTGIAAMAAKQKSGGEVKTETEEEPKRTSQKNSKAGRDIQKSFHVTKEMNRALLLAKADYEMTYDAIINEALELWLAKKGAKPSR
tara:strand:+ start:202 stop:471 length:270 start_codon:yes stop_codon:yes gene_type:complete